MNKPDSLWRYALIPVLVITADRITKYFALAHCREGCILNQFLSLNLAFNRGISWGTFSQAPGNVFYLVTALVVLVTFGLASYTIRRMRMGKSIWAELLVLAGSFSNMFDRFVHGGVVDFILVSYGTYSWPMFNVADICIVTGVAAMVFAVYKREWNRE